MLNKAQKKTQIELGSKKIKESKNLVFADFSGVPTADINALKLELRKAGASFTVLKKRLLKIALKDAGIEFDPSQFKAPIATVFASSDLTSVAAPIYKFSKDLAKRKKDFKVVAAFDREKNVAISAAEFTIIAKLPSREVLLGQVIGAMTGPLRAFMYILDQLSKKTNNPQPTTDNKTAESPAVAEAMAGPKVEQK